MKGIPLTIPNHFSMDPPMSNQLPSHPTLTRQSSSARLREMIGRSVVTFFRWIQSRFC